MNQNIRINPLTRLGLDGSARVLVVGLGKTGLSIARFLAAQGIQLAVTDTREKPPGLAQLTASSPDVAVFLGGFRDEVFAAATHLVVSPGVSVATPEIAKIAAMGVPVLGDVDLFACMAQAPVVAITGANGKSTVTTLMALMAERDGRKVKVGGNLGTPMLDLIDSEAELYVLELSSFQLETAHELKPVAATVLNISPDHMDRYPDMQAYAAAKQRVFTGNGLKVLNADDAWVAAMTDPARREVSFSVRSDTQAEYVLRSLHGEEWLVVREEPLLRAAEVRIKGRHNLANGLAAVALGDACGLSRAAMTSVLREFPGLDHRMQWVAERNGVTWINDSKATNIGACMAALDGLTEKAVLIAGGDGKGADFSPLAEIAEKKLRAAVLMGRDGPLLERVLQPVVTTARVENMKQAVEMAARLAQAGDTVLLAPACASLDQYQDYQERGRVFADAVKRLSA